MIRIHILPTTGSAPAGKLADAELHFTDGPLIGLKLIGFAVWEGVRGGRRRVTVPARTYAVNGERRSFALLRPFAENAIQQPTIEARILAAYRDIEDAQAVDAATVAPSTPPVDTLCGAPLDV